MRLDGRRESSNVDDRRRIGGGKTAGLSLGGVLIVGLVTLLMGGNFGDVVNNVSNMGSGSIIEQTSEREFTKEEQELASFAKKVLASTEDIWTEYFRQNGYGEYNKPTMVLYSGAVNTACGQGSSSVGPFYCSADKCLYIDLSFFTSMKSQLGADGDFAYAYVIAHEVGHHVQNELGILGKAHQQMARMGKADSNRMSVRIELQADFIAGVWGHYEDANYNSLDDGDLMEAIKCAQVIGDDYLQKKARGYAVEESFTHGTASQRMKWLKKGLQTGDLSKSDTFSLGDAQL